MVNVDVSPSVILGVGLIGAGVSLWQIRRSKPWISKDYDVVVSCISLLVGGILIFQGWRLDPLLLFGQLMTTGAAVSFAVEALRLRSRVYEQEEAAALQDAFQRKGPSGGGGGASFQLPPPPPVEYGSTRWWGGEAAQEPPSFYNYQEDEVGAPGYGAQGQYQGGDQYQGDEYVQADYYPPGSAGYDPYGGEADDGGYPSGSDELSFSEEAPKDGSGSTDRGENEDW